jgi:hypothetical protein
MIIEFHRGHIRLKIDEKIILIEGEALLPGHGSPDFFAYRNSLARWEHPKGELITDSERKEIENLLTPELAKKGMSVEFE